MTGIIKTARNLAGSIGNVSALLLGNVFAWLWFSALLIVVGAFMVLAPIDTVGRGGRSLTQVLAMIGGFLLVGAGASWIWHKLGAERQRIAGCQCESDRQAIGIDQCVNLAGQSTS